MGARVLVIDDDETVAAVVLDYLRRAGYTTAHCADGTSGLAAALGPERPDLVILDLMLPGLDGIAVCRELRGAGVDAPVIMLTALGEEEDRVLGLEVGADDYVTKPFSPRELVLRVESVLRRTRAGVDASPREQRVVRSGRIALDLGARRVKLDDREISLTLREFDLLAFLMQNPGQAYRRDELLEQVWGWSFGDQSTVTVHIRRLREKVEVDSSMPMLIATVWGVGYRWAG